MKNSILQYIKGIFTKLGRKKEMIEYEDYNPEAIIISKNLEENIIALNHYLKNSDDLIIRKIHISTKPNLSAAIIFLESLVDNNALTTSVITPLLQGMTERYTDERLSFYSGLADLAEGFVANTNISYINNYQAVVKEILSGKGVLLVDRYNEAISVSILKNAARTYAEPKTEQSVRGPQQGFVEDLLVNISLVRRNIKSQNLAIKKLQVGSETKTDIAVVYLNNIADTAIVDELFIRLNRIDVDGIVGSSAIEEYINDSPMNIFKTTFFTERPDRLQSMLLEGRIGIVCDGSPFVSVVPAIISDFFITAEDYYLNPYFSTFNRLIRYISSFILVFFPALYIAISTFHQEMIPTRLALTLAGTRAGVPYPAFVEAFLMEITLETLREAGTRLPTYIGQTISIVGALIIGQAAVEAGLVSPAVVIVVAATAIFSFTLPFTNYSLSLRIVRFPIMVLAATLGIYGIMTGALILTFNLISLRSFGVPFMVPFAPISLPDMKDWVLRLPQWAITDRSKHIVKDNNSKKSKSLKPGPPN